jgi:MFS family permease
MFAALQFPNFRTYFCGYLPSVAGTFMQNAALAWLVFELTKSNQAVSIVMAFLLVPTVLLMVPAGAVADRFDRRKLLMLAQGAYLVQSLLVWAVVAGGHLTTTNAALLCALGGVCLAFEIPARMPLVCTTVDAKTIPNAIALNSLVFHSGITIGRALAAICLAAGYVNTCFLINAASFAVELLALYMLRGNFRSDKPAGNTLADIREGFVAFMSDPLLRRVLVVTCVLGFFGMQFQPLSAGFTVLLGGDAGTAMAVFLSAVGLGQVAGSLTLAQKANKDYVADNLWIGYVLLGLATFGLVFSGNLWSACTAALAIGYAVPLCVTGGNTCIQLQAGDKWRGRATSIYFTVFLGSEPLGYPVGGFIADRIGVGTALSLAATACLAAGAWYWRTAPAKPQVPSA